MTVLEVMPNFIAKSALQLFILAVIPLFLTIRHLVVRRPLPKRTPNPISKNYPVVGAFDFFNNRWDFFRQAISQSPNGNFSFHLGKIPVVGLSGLEARRIFFETKDLSFNGGYAALFGHSPSSSAHDGGFAKWSRDTLTGMLKRERLVRCLPKLLADTRESLEEIAMLPTGIFDPFDNLYRTVFRLTMRTVGCNDIANDPPLLWKTLRLFEIIEESSTMTTVIFPWLPTPARISRAIAGGRLYAIVRRIVNHRKKTGKKEDDPLQYMVDEGDDLTSIITFIIGALFAGQLNASINAAWIACYLALNPEWMTKVREEVATVANRYNPKSTAPLVDQLSNIPVEAWETEFETIDLCLRDSIRLQLLGSAFRRNLSGKDIALGDQVIPNGACVAYHLADIHNDPSIYRDPDKWDPSRYLPERAEDRKVPYGYLGWGAGRHPCLGMRFAKLEINVIIAHLIAMFEYQLCTRDGQIATQLPKVDINGHAASKPREPVFLKVRRLK